MPKIYFIIVTYNAMKWAEKCFSSLRKSSVSVNVIVVDNGSTDGTKDFIKNNFPEVEFIQSPENLGFGKANNLGIETAYKKGGDFFYLMNQDAWLYKDSLEELLKVYDSYQDKKEVGILSPTHLDGSEKKLDIFLDKYIAQNFETRMISDFFLESKKSFYEISFINAAHWLITKDTIEKVGGFNPYFFHYGEDNEYVNRLRFHNKKILLVTKSKAIHDGKQDLAKVDYSKYQDFSAETKILNPNLNLTPEIFEKSLKMGILKNTLSGNFQEVKQQREVMKRIKKNVKELKELKEILTTNMHPFLNL